MVREAIAVLAAILAAFALDAWWDARVERDDALALLRSVDDRMEEHIRQIDSVNAVNARVVRTLGALADADPVELDTLGIEELVARYASFSDFQSLTPELGAVQALTGSAVFGAIRSPELRTALASVPALWAEADEEAETIERNGWAAAVGMFVNADPSAAGGDIIGSEPPMPEAFRAVVKAVMATPESRAEWMTIGLFTTQYMAELERLRARLVEIREMTAEEIG